MIFFIEKFGFVKRLKSWTYISYHKKSFSNVSTKKFSRFFKFSVSSGFDWSSLFFNRSKRQKENLVFKLKLLGLLNSFPISFDQSSLFLCAFRFLPNSSRLIEFWIFFKKRNKISFLNYSFVFLSDSFFDPFSPIFFYYYLFW